MPGFGIDATTTRAGAWLTERGDADAIEADAIPAVERIKADPIVATIRNRMFIRTRSNLFGSARTSPVLCCSSPRAASRSEKLLLFKSSSQWQQLLAADDQSGHQYGYGLAVVGMAN